MLEITNEIFDSLIEKIDNTELPPGYTFPTYEEAENLLTDIDGLESVLLAAEKTTDDKLSKELNGLIRDYVIFCDEDSEPIVDFEASESQSKRLAMISKKVEKMNFVFPGFCPTEIELDEIAKKNLKEDNVAVGFLIWVSNLEKDPYAGSNVTKISQYARKILKDTLK